MRARSDQLTREQLLSSETAITSPGRDEARLRACLLYSNSYHTGMSSLAVHTLYSLLNGLDELSCQRAFLPSTEETERLNRHRQRLSSLETDTPLDDFDLLAVTTSFELDWLNLPLCLDLGGIPPGEANVRTHTRSCWAADHASQQTRCRC